MTLNLTHALFALYLIFLCLYMLVAGANFARIGMFLNANPRIITLLLPLLTNVRVLLFSSCWSIRCSTRYIP